MITGISHVALLVRDYDEALDFYCTKLGFERIEDIPLAGKRWVRIRPSKSVGTDLVLVKAIEEPELAIVGKQAAERVFLFLRTDNLDDDVSRLENRGVRFVLRPTVRDHGKVAVFVDLYGNRIDLIEPNSAHR